jgi:uncharacterized protein with ParB-like and HNH nuclease domain
MTNGNNKPKLEYDLVSVKKLFWDDHYIVPRYQRGYAWGEEQVGILLDDLDLSYDESKTEEYLLGQIIVCPSDTRLADLDSIQWDLIDGQQRCTTLYLMALYFYKRLNRIPATPKVISEWNLLISHSYKDGELARIKPASNGDIILSALLSDDKIPSLDGPTAANIISAWSQICEYFDSYNDERAQDFAKYLKENVKLIRLELEDAKHAMRIFSRVNNRGLVLDDSDLIKNFLFQGVSDSEFDALAKHWNDAANLLDGSRLKRTKNMDFLLKLKAGIMTGKSISTNNLFGTFAPTRKIDQQKESSIGESAQLDSAQKVKEFALSLPANAKMIKQLSLNNVEQLEGYDDWSYFAYLRKFVQHFEVLLAGAHLTDDAYKILNRMVQDRMVLAVLSKTVKEFERNVHPWAHNVSKLDANPTKKELIQAATDAGAFEELDTLFDTAFIRVSSLRYTTQSHQEVLRYLLARASRIYQEEFDAIETQMKSYMRTSGKSDDKPGFDLDHIFPQNPSKFENFEKPVNWVSFKPEEQSTFENKYVHSLGNLALLHPKDNRLQSDALPWDQNKQENYKESELYLNRLVAGNYSLLSKSSREITDGLGLNRMPTTSKWTSAEIDLRARVIWDVIKTNMVESFGLN